MTDRHIGAMHNWRWLILTSSIFWLVSQTVGATAEFAPPALPASNLSAGALPLSTVGVNFNDGSRLQPELPEHIYRTAAPGNWPVPAISGSDLASGITPVIVAGSLHALSGPPHRLTDGAGASSHDDPQGNCFFDNGVRAGRLCISLAKPQAIGQINLYSWHRDPLAGGSRAPLKVNVYASDGTARGFKADDPQSPGYVLLARISTARPGGANSQAGQHAASIVARTGNSLGTFSHFLFEVKPPVDGMSHTFLNEIDIVAAVPAESRAVATQPNRFDIQIAPILARCIDCHNPADRKAGLDLTRAESAMAGGESGAAISPGIPDDSLLLRRVLDDEMPPEHPLPDREKRQLRAWIAGGAVWGSRPLDRFKFSTPTRAGYDWWSLKPLAQPGLPDVSRQRWVAGAIDRFVLAGLEAKGLSPAPAADRRTLIRRVTFDLTGLPPGPEEVAAFVADDSPDSYQRLVDRLLASPAYGERWARHWLDVVRFAESQGFERNKFYPSAWKYRDWVIQALNDDLPYDEFVRLQLAGDVLRPHDPQALIASGYLVCVPHDLLGLTQGSEGMRANTREDELENLVGNVGQTFLGLTINCARCHDHKFDPLRQSEYYQLAAALGGIERAERRLTDDTRTIGSARLQESAELKKLEAQLVAILGGSGSELIRQARARGVQEAAQAHARAKNSVAEAEKKLAGFQSQVGKPGAPRDILVAVANARQVVVDRRRELSSAEDEQRIARLLHGTRGFDQLLAQVSAEKKIACAPLIAKLSQLEVRAQLQSSGGTAHAFASLPPRYFHVLARGNFRNPGAVVAAGGFRCIAGAPADWGLSPAALESERRMRLAEWITHPRNPLPARVIVNRLWHYHFGAGLVDTPNDFGYSGGRPSHPELLDYLAQELIREGWSLKHIQREIVLSSTYRQSGQFNPRAASIDAGNRLLWRKTPLRLEAEALRDAVLSVSGELNRRMGGPSFRDIEIGVEGDNAAYKPLDTFGPAVNRRSVYRTVVRATTPPLLETLDCADPTVATPRRNVTTTPLQALSVLNNPFMLRAAEAFAARVKREAGDAMDQQVVRAYQLAFGRVITKREHRLALAFADKYGLADLCLMIFNSNEFLYID